MNQFSNKYPVYIALILLIGSVFLVSCAVNEDAFEKMSPDEKAFVERIKMITPGMAEADIAILLGPVYRGSGTARPVWLGPTNDPESQIAVYFVEGRVQKIRWIKLGSFVWEYTP